MLFYNKTNHIRNCKEELMVNLLTPNLFNLITKSKHYVKSVFENCFYFQNLHLKQYVYNFCILLTAARNESRFNQFKFDKYLIMI